MPAAPTQQSILRRRAGLAGLWVVLFLAGCTSAPTPGAIGVPSAEFSPVAELVAPRDAWRLAQAYAREHRGAEVMVGSGDSMRPVYGDRTVLVVQPVATAELKPGMTAVFIGDRGRPVAHLLMEKTAHGWRAMGAGNRECDGTLVRADNLIGVVIRAYDPATRAEPAVATPAESAILPSEGRVASAQ